MQINNIIKEKFYVKFYLKFVNIKFIKISSKNFKINIKKLFIHN